MLLLFTHHSSTPRKDNIVLTESHSAVGHIKSSFHFHMNFFKIHQEITFHKNILMPTEHLTGKDKNDCYENVHRNMGKVWTFLSKYKHTMFNTWSHQAVPTGKQWTQLCLNIHLRYKLGKTRYWLTTEFWSFSNKIS